MKNYSRIIQGRAKFSMTIIAGALHQRAAPVTLEPLFAARTERAV